MDDLRNRRRLPHIEVTAQTLTWYGCITLLFYSISMSVIQNGMLQVNRYSGTELRELMAADPNRMLLASWAVVFQLLGGLAIPVFAFLTVEEFLHSESNRKDLLRMLIFAAVSEIPYDLAMSGKLFDWTGQNMLFSLLVGRIMLYGLRLFAASRGVQVLIVLASVFWTALLKSGFGLCLILLMAVYYLLREKPKARMLWSSMISLMYVTGPVSNFVLKRYNGQPGREGARYLFFCLYPLHLLVLAAAVHFICKG